MENEFLFRMKGSKGKAPPKRKAEETGEKEKKGSSKLKKGLPQDQPISKKLKAPIGTYVGPNVVKDVYDSATPDKVIDDPHGKKRPVEYKKKSGGGKFKKGAVH